MAENREYILHPREGSFYEQREMIRLEKKRIKLKRFRILIKFSGGRIIKKTQLNAISMDEILRTIGIARKNVPDIGEPETIIIRIKGG